MSELPRGWASIAAEDACALVQSGGTPEGKPFTPSGDVPFLKVYNIVDQSVDFEYRPQFIPRSVHERELRRSVVLPGDVLMNIVGPPLGKVALVPNTYPEWNINQAIVVFRPKPFLDSSYLYHLLCEGREIKRLEHEYRGSAGQSNISLSQARAFELAVAPLTEQRRIVSKIESLTARSRRAKEALDAIPTLLEKFRQSVLAAAFRGDLTADWREKHPDVERAEVLLKRIRIERRKRWEEAELAKMRAKGKAPGDDRWKAKYEEPAPVDTSELPELPEGWAWAAGRELFSWASGKFLGKNDIREGAIPVYGGNGISGYHAYSNVEQSTLVIGRVGANCGNVYTTNGPTWVTDNAIYAATIPSDVHLQYVAHALQIARLNERAGGSGQPFVNQTILDEAPIPLAPTSEQSRILAYIAKAEDRINKTTESMTKMSRGMMDLNRSILSKAFRGELVPQDPNDEPASVLLERIRAEAAMVEGTAKKRAGKKRG